MEGNFCQENLRIKVIDGRIESDNTIWDKYFCKYINQTEDDFSSELYDIIMESGCDEIDLRNFNGK